MRRGMIAAVVLVLPVAGAAGCATVFTGSSKKVTVETTPPRAKIAVVGGAAGTLIVKAKKYGDLAPRILKLLDPHLSKEARDALALLEVDELITLAAVFLSPTLEGIALPEKVKAELTKLPSSARREVAAILGIDRVGLAPLTCALRNGQDYAVIVYHDGYRAKVSALEAKLNWLVFLNVFNGFLGVPIDLFSGAWREVEPDRLHVTLRKRD